MTKQQQALVEQARQSLDAAKLLTQAGHHGFAAARAYYSMFYVAEELLLGEGLEYGRHSAVIAAFGERFQKTAQVPPGYHRMLLDAAECREVGDYGINIEVSAEAAERQIGNAQQFLDLAQTMLGPAPGESR